MVKIELRNISKSFRNIKALDNVNLTIEDKEYFIILGPTGAGKTTLLKIIAGLIKPDSGSILFDGVDVTSKPANERHLGYVFENYALFPHMNVIKNIGYSGRVHGRDFDETKEIAEQILMMMVMTGRNQATPDELSGGMQQRVALSRALLSLEQTGLILLDEPLKALDAGLRMSLRREIRMMVTSKELSLTAIHVTNEMEEAMMVGDKIAVLDNGKIIQVGTPHEVYYRPENFFIANFMSEINYFSGKCAFSYLESHNLQDFNAIEKNNEILEERKHEMRKIDPFFADLHKDSKLIPVMLDGEKVFSIYAKKDLCKLIKNEDKLLLVVRINHWKLRLGHRNKQNSFFGKIIRRKFMGVFYRFEIEIDHDHKDQVIVVSIPATTEIHEKYQLGLEVTVYFPPELGILFPHPGDKVIEEIIKLE